MLEFPDSEMLLGMVGLAGALCCVGMYVAVSMGWMGAEHMTFFVVNALGSMMILASAGARFDPGDIGSVSQEVVWALISLIGAFRIWHRRFKARADGIEDVAEISALPSK